jgi:hypothetical protein
MRKDIMYLILIAFIQWFLLLTFPITSNFNDNVIFIIGLFSLVVLPILWLIKLIFFIKSYIKKDKRILWMFILLPIVVLILFFMLLIGVLHSFSF